LQAVPLKSFFGWWPDNDISVSDIWSSKACIFDSQFVGGNCVE